MALLWLLFLAGTAAWFRDPPEERCVCRLPRPAVAGKERGRERASTGLLRARARGNPVARAPPCSLPIGRSQSLPNLEEPLLEEEEAGGISGIDVGGRADAGGASGQPKQHGGARDPGWKATVRGTLACVLCLFLQKAAQQAYYDSVPILTSVLYGWGSATVGIFLGMGEMRWWWGPAGIISPPAGPWARTPAAVRGHATPAPMATERCSHPSQPRYPPPAP
jgi:hypothetical protein